MWHLITINFSPSAIALIVLSFYGPARAVAWLVGRNSQATPFPHLELDKFGHYAVAKIKEVILAVTGP